MTRRSTPMRGQLAEVIEVIAAKPLPAPLIERGLVLGDGPALGQLMAAAYQGTVDDHDEDEAWHRTEAEQALQGRFGTMVWEASLVAVTPEETFAGACLVTDKGVHLLLAFALVVPRWQNRGVGSTLMARSAQALLAAGHREWTLAVTDGNPARRLYERLGFVADESLRTTPSLTVGIEAGEV